jgi:hypothetical protein
MDGSNHRREEKAKEERHQKPETKKQNKAKETTEDEKRKVKENQSEDSNAETRENRGKQNNILTKSKDTKWHKGKKNELTETKEKQNDKKHIVWSISLCADLPCSQSNKPIHRFWSYASAVNENMFQSALSLSGRTVYS